MFQQVQQGPSQCRHVEKMYLRHNALSVGGSATFDRAAALRNVKPCRVAHAK